MPMGDGRLPEERPTQPDVGGQPLDYRPEERLELGFRPDGARPRRRLYGLCLLYPHQVSYVGAGSKRRGAGVRTAEPPRSGRSAFIPIAATVLVLISVDSGGGPTLNSAVARLKADAPAAIAVFCWRISIASRATSMTGSKLSRLPVRRMSASCVSLPSGVREIVTSAAGSLSRPCLPLMTTATICP